MTTSTSWDKARNHLRRHDAVLRPVIKSVGPCTLQPISDLFAALVYSIVSQQISMKAASSIRTRLVNEACRGTLSPAALLRATEEELRLAGLSTSKRRSILDLARRVDSGSLKLEELRKLPDEEVIEQLIPVHGIGRWTAQMFLIFSLGRPDVLPVDDFGLRTAIQRCYRLKTLPDRTTIETTAEPWRPWCSVATWYLWRSLDARLTKTRESST
jgi:DNA-3-methyladenine glycosylase II